MFKNALISLAAIRALYNTQKDYLDFIVPFVQEACQNVDSPFDCIDIVRYISRNFGLSIPQRTVELTLKKIIRKKIVTKKDKKYFFSTTSYNNYRILDKVEESKAIINDVILDIQRFSIEKTHKDITEDQVVNAIIHFLSLFSVECLKFYHQKSVLPVEEIKQEDWQVILISAYIYSLIKHDTNSLDKFMVVAYGHMLTTSLLCPDLQEASKSYKNVQFFFDTSNIIESLGLDGQLAQESTALLFTQINNLGGKLCCFTHTVDEIKHVITSASRFIDQDEGNSGIVIEARRKGLEPADLIFYAESIEEKILNLGLEIVPSPGYIKDFQIDEKVFGEYLGRFIAYKNKNAKNIDINSIRCIFAIRKNEKAISLEKTRAIFVTKNTAFANSSCEYAYEIEKTVLSPAIDSFTLASMAWLKSPIDAPQLPAKELMAFSYAALRPDNDFWMSVIRQAERLKDNGDISNTQLQVIRASVDAQEHVFIRSLGNAENINKETITEAIENATESIKNEANAESKQTIDELNKKVESLQSDLEKRKEQEDKKRKAKIQWCKKQATKRTGMIYYSCIVAIVILLVFIKQPNLNNLTSFFGLEINNIFLKWIFENLNESIGTIIGITGFTTTNFKNFLYIKIYNRIVATEQEKGDLDTSMLDGLPNHFS